MIILLSCELLIFNLQSNLTTFSTIKIIFLNLKNYTKFVMVQKNLDKDSIINKGQVHTFLGDFNLYSIKSSIKPVFTINVHSIILILVSIVVFIISSMNIGQLLNVFLLIVSIDLLISSLIVKPLNY